MQFDVEPPFALAVTGYGAEGIAIQGRWYRQSLLLGSDGVLLDWPLHGEGGALTQQDLAWVLEQAAKNTVQPYEMVILGTGARQAFPDPAWLQPFMVHGLPLECMDTPAACRTYNIVAAEGRRVLAALIPCC